MTRVSSQQTRQFLLTMGDPQDPLELPERIQLFNEEGEPLGLGGFPRETRTHETAILADRDTEYSTWVVWPGWRALKAETDVPARVRVYSSSAQRLADAERKIGVDPKGNHGLLFELVSTEEQLIYTLSPKVDFATDDEDSSDYFMAVTNLSGDPNVVTTTFYLVRTE